MRESVTDAADFRLSFETEQRPRRTAATAHLPKAPQGRIEWLCDCGPEPPDLSLFLTSAFNESNDNDP